MNDKARIALILGAAVAAVGGGGYYFFKVYQPAQKREAAQVQVDEWERRLGAARTCLFGTTPASGNSAEALAVREMMPDPWERKTCTSLIGRLNRGIAEDTGLMTVEHAWMTIDRAASKVANAFATHVDPFGEAYDARGKPSPLPAALEALDAAHAELRAAAGMSPPPTATQASLPVAALIPLAAGSHRVKALDAWPPPSGSGSIAFGSTATGQVQLLLVPGAAPKVEVVPHRALRATPDATWGAAGLGEEISIAPIDDTGAFGAATPIKATGPSVLTAVGTLASGLVVAADETGLVIARSTNGVFAAEPPVPALRAHAATEPGGRTAVVWNRVGTDADGDEELGALQGFLAFGDSAPVVVELGDGTVRGLCLTHEGAWIDAGGQFVSFDGTTAAPHVMTDHGLLGCTADAALLHDAGNSRYAVCGASCRQVELTNFRSTRIATIANGKVHAVRARGRVLGVWRENLPPRFFAIEREAVPVQLTSDGKVLDVLATSDEGVVLLRVPVD